MEGQSPYTSNWTGAMAQTPRTPIQNGQMPNQFGNQMNNGFNTFSFNPNPLIIVPVSNEQAVNNYLVERGVTAFLINYKDGIFWTKRLNDNGLGYDVVKHKFYVDVEKPRMETQQPTNPIDSQAQLTAIQEELAKLRKEFDEFIK